MIGALELFKLLCLQLHALLVVTMLVGISLFILDMDVLHPMWRSVLTMENCRIGLRIWVRLEFSLTGLEVSRCY